MMNTSTHFPASDGLEFCRRFGLSSNFGNEFSSVHHGSSQDEVVVGTGSDRTVVQGDYFDGVFKYIQQMLMEEDDLENRPCMFQDCTALQAAEKSFYDALNPPPPARTTNYPVHRDFIDNTHWQDNYSDAVSQFVESNIISDLGGGDQCSLLYSGLNNNHQAAAGAANNGDVNSPDANNYHQVSALTANGGDVNSQDVNNNQGDKSRSDGGRKKHNREENGDISKGRNSKQFASNGTEETEEDKTEEYYDKALLCPGMNPSFYENRSKSSTSSDNAAWDKQKSCHIKQSKRGRPRGSKKGVKTNEVVDLTSLLTRCAEAAASYNSKTFMEVLKKIRQHSSPYGDATARLAYCFANALEARFAGGDATLVTTSMRIPAADFLKAYQVYITACPFKRMSNIFANKSIAKLTGESPRIHIIDFGILYGFQWPCIIHGISLRPGGPPKLKITGIDFPQPGFRPAERVEETGRRLENFSKRFGVPFEYKAIAKKWDDIKLEDLEIDRDEMLVVNCLYRLKNVPDETVVTTRDNRSLRDAVLNLIREINPHYFVHGIVNAMYNASFFTTRFREALFHFSSQFDMFEATMLREDEGRMTFEQEVFGRDIMNVIACEGTERVERPESYKQWSMRNQIAGFRQLPLDRDIVNEVKAKVRMFYHSDFLVDEDSNWMLQGWKGRIMYALSVWEPINK
ncbi:scarecrow-like protein 30 [Lycium ferocissimum]|uniref:scarecrow-like protein 30 n=1 Tax=Lycium ferocissimum TaxID=112874 RepID=UPI002814EB20|nr:scarecrow-like protein 30 [Lycium ferocissimum]